MSDLSDSLNLVVASACLGPIHRMAARDDPHDLAEYLRGVSKICEQFAAELRTIGHTAGQVLDIVSMVDLAEAAAEMRADRAREPPFSQEGRYGVRRLWAHGMAERRLDVLFGWRAETVAAFLERRPPPKYLREMVRAHRAGLTDHRIATHFGIHKTTVREALGAIGLEPNPMEDRRRAADFRPKVVALAAQHIAHRGEPDVSKIRESLAREGFELTVTQVKNAVRAARKRGDLPPVKRSSHGCSG